MSWDQYWQGEDLDYWRRPAPSVREFLEQLDPTRHPRVLDLGCGLGRHAHLFAQAGFEVTAVDHSGPALVQIPAHPGLRNCQGNYLDPLFAPGSFDIVLSYNVLYHGSKEEFARGVALALGYLDMGGLFFFTCPTRDDGKYGSGREVAPHTYESLNSVHPGDRHYFASEEDIREITQGVHIVSLNRDEHHWDSHGETLFSSYWEIIVQK